MNRLTVVIVNFNSKDYLQRCLESLREHQSGTEQAVVVIDNASDDRDFSRLSEAHPTLRIVQNLGNRGFSTACNQGIRALPARYYLLLNPDCQVLEGTIDSCLRFLEERPEAGIVGCRVTYPDGTLQLACRRRIPRPSSALFRFLGLSRLFPNSRRFADYNLTYLDEKSTQEVEAVSGSFLMFRHELLESSGWMDEDFFLYGEDLDFCYRALRKGWKVYYHPRAQVIHHKGRSGATAPGPTRFHYYDAMEIFFRKHYRDRSGRLKTALVIGAIRLLHVFSRLRHRLPGGKTVVSNR